MALPELAVTGSTGALGGRVARRLADRGVAQRLVVRDVANAPALAGASPVAAPSYGDTAAMRDALAGAKTLFLVSGRETKDRLEQHYSAIDAAVDAGVERIVYVSFLGAAPDATRATSSKISYAYITARRFFAPSYIRPLRPIRTFRSTPSPPRAAR